MFVPHAKKPEIYENQRDTSLADDLSLGFTTVWNAVVSELNGESNTDDEATNDSTLVKIGRAHV